jgi:hypothetical protein
MVHWFPISIIVVEGDCLRYSDLWRISGIYPHPPNPARRSRRERTRIHAAVLGGGLTGLSAAYFIRQVSPGKRVAVLEARGCGDGH